MKYILVLVLILLLAGQWRYLNCFTKATTRPAVNNTSELAYTHEGPPNPNRCHLNRW